MFLVENNTSLVENNTLLVQHNTFLVNTNTFLVETSLPTFARVVMLGIAVHACGLSALSEAELEERLLEEAKKAGQRGATARWFHDEDAEFMVGISPKIETLSKMGSQLAFHVPIAYQMAFLEIPRVNVPSVLCGGFMPSVCDPVYGSTSNGYKKQTNCSASEQFTIFYN